MQVGGSGERNCPPYNGLKVWVSGPSGVSGFAGDPTSLARDNIWVFPDV